MTVTVEGLQDVNRVLSGISSIHQNAIDFNRLAAKGRQIIAERTEQGFDSSHTAFTPYSANYLEYKEERAGHPVNKVDLYDYGLMSAAMTSGSTLSGSRIFFSDGVQREKARKHNEGAGNLPKRLFFAMNADEVDNEIMPLAQRDVDDYMRSL